MRQQTIGRCRLVTSQHLLRLVPGFNRVTAPQFALGIRLPIDSFLLDNELSLAFHAPHSQVFAANCGTLDITLDSLDIVNMGVALLALGLGLFVLGRTESGIRIR